VPRDGAARPVIDEGFAPRRGADVHTVVLDGEAVLLDERENRLHLLNHTATLLWQLYDGEASLAELATDVSAELAVDRDTVLADLLTITRHLGAEGILDGVVADREGDE